MNKPAIGCGLPLVVVIVLAVTQVMGPCSYAVETYAGGICEDVVKAQTNKRITDTESLVLDKIDDRTFRVLVTLAYDDPKTQRTMFQSVHCTASYEGGDIDLLRSWSTRDIEYKEPVKTPWKGGTP